MPPRLGERRIARIEERNRYRLAFTARVWLRECLRQWYLVATAELRRRLSRRVEAEQAELSAEPPGHDLPVPPYYPPGRWY
jgi:hypothetical protein